VAGSTPTEIGQGVYAIPLRSARAFLICEERLTLIDAGLPGSRPAIEAAVRALGRSLDELERVVCTHGHPDHAGGARELAADGVEIMLHPADLAALSTTMRGALSRPTRGRFFASVTPEPARAVAVSDGDLIPVLGGLQVVHTPGHTPGSICLYAPREGLLFVGDALQARRGRVGFASRLFSDDYARARLSVKRLAELDVKSIVFSHWPPWRDDPNGLLRKLAAEAAAETPAVA
jgi:glyoxylase-like metal-dependent hydrolase (beta-lactamase superfamily II)